jgi:hypothetical protein
MCGWPSALYLCRKFVNVWCHFGLPPCRCVPFREFPRTTCTYVSTFFWDKMTAPLIAKKHPASDRVFALRRYLVGFLFVLIFVLLDRTTSTYKSCLG